MKRTRLSSLPVAVSALLASALLAGCPGGPTQPSVTSESCHPAVLTPGGSVNDNTGPSDNRCKAPDGHTNLFYTFDLTTQAAVRLTVSGNAFPGYLALWTSDGKLIWQVAAPTTLEIAIVLPPGKYLVSVDSKTGADGPFTLSAPLIANTSCLGIFAMKGVTVSGVIASNSCVSGVRSDRVTVLAAESGQSATITTTVDKAVSVLVVLPGNVTAASKAFGPGAWTTTVPIGAFDYGGGFYYTNLIDIGVPVSTSLPVTYTLKVE